jgi:hypothetical protein
MIKTTTILILLILTLGVKTGYSQSQVTDTIYVSLDHNMYLIFDEEVKPMKGNQEIEVIEQGNKIVVMAKIENFYETNLFVEMGDEYYMFIIKYEPKPKKFIYNYQTKNNTKPKAVSKDYSKENKRIEVKKETDSLRGLFKEIETKVNNKGQNVKALYLDSYGFKGIITNIYAHDDYIVLKLFIENESNIKYNVDFLGFTISTKRKNVLQSNSTEEYSIKKQFPFKGEDLSVLQPQTKYEQVYIFDKFTIEKKKNLVFEITEVNGDRRLKIQVPYQYIIKADLL